MNRADDFSEADYQDSSVLKPEERRIKIEAEDTPIDIKALLLYQEGRQLADKQRDEEALDCFCQAIELKPNYSRAWKDQGIACLG